MLSSGGRPVCQHPSQSVFPEAGHAAAAVGAGGKVGRGCHGWSGSKMLRAELNALQTSPNLIITTTLKSTYHPSHFKDEKPGTQRGQEAA